MANDHCRRSFPWLYAMSAVSFTLLFLVLGYTDATALDARVKNLVRWFSDERKRILKPEPEAEVKKKSTESYTVTDVYRSFVEDPFGLETAMRETDSIHRLALEINVNEIEDLYMLLSDDKETLYDAVKEQLTRCWRQSAYWKMYSREKCYTLTTEQLSWHDARGQCAERGGLLWTVERPELGFLVDGSFFNNDTDFNVQIEAAVWAGASPNDFDYWIDGSPVQSDRWDEDFAFLADFNFRFHREDLCMAVGYMLDFAMSRRSYHGIRWFKIKCKDKRNYICQHDADPPLPEAEAPGVMTDADPSLSEEEAPGAMTEKVNEPKPRIKEVTVMVEAVNCKGFKISTRPSWSYHVSGVTDCGRICKQQKACQLFNYNHGKHVCNGYTSDTGLENSTVQEEGWRTWRLKIVTA